MPTPGPAARQTVAARQRVDDLGADQLTLAILSAMARGMNTTDAAAACNVSLSTLRRRLDNARRSWGLEHNIELVVHAVRAGLI